MPPKPPQLEWSEAARADLLAIIEYIAEDSPRAAQALKDEIEAKVRELPNFPKKYARSQRAPGYRQLTVRSNYLVFYRLHSEAMPQWIDIAAVVHARRKWP